MLFNYENSRHKIVSLACAYTLCFFAATSLSFALSNDSQTVSKSKSIRIEAPYLNSEIFAEIHKFKIAYKRVVI